MGSPEEVLGQKFDCSSRLSLSAETVQTLISCHQGLRASNGSVGVGRGTTNAMVYSSLAILITNFFLSLLMQMIFPAGLVAK